MLPRKPQHRPVSRYPSWQAGDYYKEYYSRRVQPDDSQTLQFQLDFLRQARRKFPLALEYGCDPVLCRAIAAAPYVRSLHMADYLDSNIARIRRWIEHSDQHDEDNPPDDWSAFTEFVLEREGTQPDEEAVTSRENLTKKVVADLLLTDAKQRYPLGEGRQATYDLLITGFCLECISASRTTWLRCMKNVFGLVKHGGSFVLAALKECEAYRVGDRWFPACKINAGELAEALGSSGCDPASLDIQDRKMPTNSAQGFRGILLASGRKAPC